MLSETAANFEYLEIFFTPTNNSDYHYFTSVRVYLPDSKKASLFAGYSVDGIFQITNCVYTISGLSMIRSSPTYANLLNNAVPIVGGASNIAIFRIVGYRV